ncbi:MAG: hypothetical protein J1E35_03280 [Lachnospiraceae bacterium]|nr:hypothetical protein [Lachnospiraceae bacterium]
MAKKATEKKSAEKKEAEEVKAVEAEVSAVEEKTTAAEAAPVAEAVVKEPKKRGRKPGSKNAVKTVKTIKKDADAKKTETQEIVCVQFSSEEIVVSEVMDKARAAYVAEGHRLSSIKSLRLYIKPEEKKAYYVINDKAAGSIEL